MQSASDKFLADKPGIMAVYINVSTISTARIIPNKGKKRILSNFGKLGIPVS
jgi:hypothetical protein